VRRWRRILAICLLLLAVGALAAWRWQNEIVGAGARVYLARVAAEEEESGELTQRRAAVMRINRALLLEPPADALVPELFDLLGALSPRVASGQIDLDWAAYVYTSYLRDMVRDRPRGKPRRTPEAIEAAVIEYVRFYSLQKRPDVPGIGVDVLRGAQAGESYTVEEIERAEREGRDLTRP
jgi:hypothetical protein